MKVRRLLSGKLLILLVCLVGCNLKPRLHSSNVEQLNEKTGYWFNYDASRRGAILTPKMDGSPGVYMCAEPSPDVALENAVKLLGELQATVQSGGEGALKAQAEFSEKLVELAGRTQTILFLREALYRLCEQQMNGALSSTEVDRLYAKVIETSITLAEAQIIETLSKVEKSDVANVLMDNFIRGQTLKSITRTFERTHPDEIIAVLKPLIEILGSNRMQSDNVQSR